MKKVLLLTNSDNDDAGEDERLAAFLAAHFDITSIHPRNAEPYFDIVDAVLIRNIWPTHEYLLDWQAIKAKLNERTIPIYNTLDGSGDNEGKDYLLQLYQKGFPVIPTTDSIAHLEDLPNTEHYWIKPKYSCDGFGSRKVSASELAGENLHECIIQPYMEFECEKSFYFFDNVFHYAFTTKHRLQSETVEVHMPTKVDLAFAQQFVDWNTLSRGIQRIDTIETKDGLLLTEVEDNAPYLYLEDLSELIEQNVFSYLKNKLEELTHS